MSDESPRSTPPMSSDSEDDQVRHTTFGNNMDSEPEGEDMDRTIAQDYRARPELDRYEEEGIDHTEYQPLSVQQIYEADREIMNRRDNDAFWGQDARNFIETRRLQELIERPTQQTDMNAIFEQPDPNQQVYLQEITGPLQPYLERPEIKIEIGRKFRLFIQEFKDSNGNRIYLEKIKRIAMLNKESFEVSYSDLAENNSLIAVWICEAPDIIIPILSDTALLIVNRLYESPHIRKITVRITNLPLIDSIRDLRQMHLNCLIRTVGVVTRVFDILPNTLTARWRCTKCGHIQELIEDVDDKVFTPSFCANCNSKSGFEIDDTTRIYRNVQRIIVQEPLSLVPPGGLPRMKEVILLDDNVGTVRPGEEIYITGIYKHIMHTKPTGFPVFSTIIEANYILKSDDEYASLSNTEDEKEQILQLSPSILRHDDIKSAIALALFYGTRIENEDHSFYGTAM